VIKQTLAEWLAQLREDDEIAASQRFYEGDEGDEDDEDDDSRDRLELPIRPESASSRVMRGVIWR
jgi:hypothetical protein